MEGGEGVRGREGIPGPPARDREGAGAFCEERGLGDSFQLLGSLMLEEKFDYGGRRNFGAPGDSALELMV